VEPPDDVTPLAPARRGNSSGRGRGRAIETGSDAELEVVRALRRAGYRVFAPCFAPDSPYDLVIDDAGRLSRVQVKTGFLHHSESVRWTTRSVRPGYDRDYHGRADFFAVWVPENTTCYLVPVAECPTTEAALRLAPAKNGQVRGTRRAADYAVRPRA
jgi:hypothetical protein